MTEPFGPPLTTPLFGDATPCRSGAVAGLPLPARPRGWYDAPVGEPGQLFVHGEPGVSLMAGYLKNQDATAAVIQDGWLATGDIVRLDEDGFVSLRRSGQGHDQARRRERRRQRGRFGAEDHPAVIDAA